MVLVAAPTPLRPAGLDVGVPGVEAVRFDAADFLAPGFCCGDALALLFARVVALVNLGLQAADLGAGVVQTPGAHVADRHAQGASVSHKNACAEPSGPVKRRMRSGVRRSRCMVLSPAWVGYMAIPYSQVPSIRLNAEQHQSGQFSLSVSRLWCS